MERVPKALLFHNWSGRSKVGLSKAQIGNLRIHYSSITGVVVLNLEKSLGNSKGCSGADCPEMVDFTEISF